MIKLTTNHFRLTSRPQWALYQYHVGYSPEMEARRLRSALLFQHEETIGRTHAFDGCILFLPKKLDNKVRHRRAASFGIMTCVLFLFLASWGELRELTSHEQ